MKLCLSVCLSVCLSDEVRHTPVTQRQPTRQRTTNAMKSISGHGEKIPVWEQLVTDQFDPWQVVPRQVFNTAYSRLLISTVFVVVSRVGCFGLPV